MRRTVLSVVLALGTVVGTAASVPAAAPAPTAGARAAAEVELPRPVRGANAVRLLAGQLDETAARNDMSGAELTDLLTSDPTAWIDTTGAVFFKEAIATAPADDPVSTQAPLSETFQLHSKPGSGKTIFLDFDGASAYATGWHTSYPATPTTQPAWDTGGDPAVFDAAERTAIQTIWQSVAEDYAPFDVDVTTADPGAGGINRSSLPDTAYGSHVLITPSAGAHDAICNPLNNGSGCGGVAYVGVFDKVASGSGDGYGSYQPAWVFPQKLGNSPKSIAEAASHEVGHQFGLRHDANPTQGYDSGHGAWAPIMGVGYNRPISQWSKGDYTGATNQEDDVEIIRAVAGSRVDEAPSTVLLAPAMPSGTAYVGSRTDVDTYLLGSCAGSVSVVANPLASLADLDIQLTILDSLGRVVATDDPASGQATSSAASGLGASVTRTLAPGTYYASVDGVGNGPWSTGYDDYGSLGAYTLGATGCDGILGPVLTTTSLVATVVGRTVTLTATPAALGAVLAGDVVFREGSTVVGTTAVGAGSPVVVLASVTPGTHTYTASYVPLDPAQVDSTSAPASVAVRATSTTTLTASESGGDVTLEVRVATDGGAPSGTVELRDGDTVVGTRTLSDGAASVVLTSVAPGDHAYRATFVPTDATTYDGSSSAVRGVTVVAPAVVVPTTVTPTAVSGSTTTLKAPRKARAGTRPTVTVTVVRGAAEARGTVVVTVGKRSTTLTLKAGTARLTLPRLKAGKVRISVRYAGDPTTTASTARRTIRVRA